MIKFAERLQELRRERHMTQREMAEFLQIQLRSYQSYEGDDRRPGSPGGLLWRFYGLFAGALRGAVAVQWDESRDHVDGLATHPRFLFKASKRKRAASVSGTAANGCAMRGQKKKCRRELARSHKLA